MASDMGVSWREIMDWTCEQFTLHSHVWLLRKDIEVAMHDDAKADSDRQNRRRQRGGARDGSQTKFHGCLQDLPGINNLPPYPKNPNG